MGKKKFDPDKDADVAAIRKDVRAIINRMDRITEQLQQAHHPPVHLIDQLIIGDAKLRALRSFDPAIVTEPIDIPYFECGLRGHLVVVDSDNPANQFFFATIQGVDNLVDDDEYILTLVGLTADALTTEIDFELEYWVLENNEVVDFWRPLNKADGDADDYNNNEFDDDDDDDGIEHIQPLLLILMQIFVPSRSPYRLIAVAPFDGLESTHEEVMERIITISDMPTVESPWEAWTQLLNKFSGQRRWWLIIQANSDKATQVEPRDIIILDSWGMKRISAIVPKEEFFNLRSAAHGDGMYHDTSKMFWPDWTKNINSGWGIPLLDLQEETIKAHMTDGIMGVGVMLATFDPEKIPYRLVGVLVLREEHDTEEGKEIDWAEVYQDMISCDGVLTASPEEVHAQFRAQYPHGDYFVLIKTNANIPNREYPVMIDSRLFDDGVAYLVEQEASLMEYRERLSSAPEREQIPPVFEAFSRALSSRELVGRFCCENDGLPMVRVGKDYVCSGEYLLRHLSEQKVIDIITNPLQIIFSNGYRLPLYCPDCEKFLHLQPDLVRILQEVQGGHLDDVQWDSDEGALLLIFETPEGATRHAFAVHPKSAAGLIGS